MVKKGEQVSTTSATGISSDQVREKFNSKNFLIRLMKLLVYVKLGMSVEIISQNMI